MKYYSLIALSFFFLFNANAQKMNLLIGTYTHSCDSKGIYTYEFDAATGDARLLAESEKTINPSYIALGNPGFLYSVNENGMQSTVSSFSYDKQSGSLRFLSAVPAEGADPCFILNDKLNVIVANYSGGTISVFRKQPDGSLGTAVQVVQHNGTGPNKARQEKAHVHQVQFTPDRKYLVANDLGSDKISLYKYFPVAEKGVLILKEEIRVRPGSGPRHLTFSADGKFAYLLQELDGTVTVFSYHDGQFKMLQESSVVDPLFNGETGAADIHLSPDGKFLYATNRGTANDISIFKVEKTGKIKFLKRIPTLGKGPRNFTIDPAGNFLLVAHQNSNDVVIFNIDKVTGNLKDSGKRIKLCSPVCLVFNP